MSLQLQKEDKTVFRKMYYFHQKGSVPDIRISQLSNEIRSQSNPYKKTALFESFRHRWGKIKPGPAEYNLLLDLCLSSDAEIRREAAYLLLDEAVILSEEQKFLICFALKEWEKLNQLIWENNYQKDFLQLLLHVDYRTRLQAMKSISILPESTEETCLTHYLKMDFSAILEDLDDHNQEIYRQLMTIGMNDRHLTSFYRKECRQILEIIDGEKSSVKTDDSESKQDVQLKVIDDDSQNSRLLPLMQELQERGIWVDGQHLFPELHFSATGRIVYRKPGVQNLPAENKPFKLKPPSARYLLRFDFVQIEPRLLMNWMAEQFLIELNEIPEDIYLLPFGNSREESKKIVNTLINGGTADIDRNLSPFVKKFIYGIWSLRQSLYNQFKKGLGVDTIASRKINLDKNAKNLGGKLVNRFIQGSAADYFHDCILRVKEFLKGTNVELYFLLFDEAWLCADDGFDLDLENLQKVVAEPPEFYSNLVPINVRFEKLFWNGRWIIESDADERSYRQAEAG